MRLEKLCGNITSSSTKVQGISYPLIHCIRYLAMPACTNHLETPWTPYPRMISRCHSSEKHIHENCSKNSRGIRKAMGSQKNTPEFITYPVFCFLCRLLYYADYPVTYPSGFSQTSRPSPLYIFSPRFLKHFLSCSSPFFKMYTLWHFYFVFIYSFARR